MIITLEYILKHYKFIAKSKSAFRLYPKLVDDIPEYTTKAGARAYHQLINLLYDIGRLTNEDVNHIIDVLDYIVQEG